MDVAGDAIAIVGSNEAGKTTFLRAIRHLDDPDPLRDQ
jgi:ABC-type polysaccharide/polyol phosphate transport system ATPase subunit